MDNIPPGILPYNPVTLQDEDTDCRRLLIELLPHKKLLFIDELISINRFETTCRRLTIYEAKRIYAIHGRLAKEIKT
jgi:hypothetical protein